MSASVQRPHDKLFRTVFSDPIEAESFLRAYLPPTETERLAWDTLTLVETSFVDEAMVESESDLLYTVQVRETEQPVHLYILFEHQSSPDRWMRFRLLKYMCRIWDESFKAESDQKDVDSHPAPGLLPRARNVDLLHRVCRLVSRERTGPHFLAPLRPPSGSTSRAQRQSRSRGRRKLALSSC